MAEVREDRAAIGKGIVAGCIGGLVASWTMNEFQQAWSKLLSGNERSHGAQSLQQGTPEHGVGRELQERGQTEEDENAAIRAGTAVAEFIFNRRLEKNEREMAGEVAHYAMGAGSGAIYGALTEVQPKATAGAGIPFGAAVWLIADEGLVPALGLSKSADQYPLSIHVYAFASHLVYGLSTEIVRRSVRRVLS